MRARAINPILNVSDIQRSFAWFAKPGWEKAWDCAEMCDLPDGGRNHGKWATIGARRP